MKIGHGNRKEWTRADAWTKLCPHLSIEVRTTNNNDAVIMMEYPKDARYRNRLREQGFATVDQKLPKALIEKLRRGMEQLHQRNLPATFILLFDEAWQLARLSRQLLSNSTLESNEFQFDILAWYIDAADGRGFSPHRDRQPDEPARSFASTGDAMFVTHWIALTAATPASSCLYVIPKAHDPGYTTGDADDDSDPLAAALPNKQAFQRIRALPREPGQSLLFTHRLLHWGSARDPHETSTTPPRLAISFVCSDPAFEKPYLVDSTKHWSDDIQPPLSIRLLVVCAQLLIYYQRFELETDTLHACYRYCQDLQQELETSYREKVFCNFVKAMKEKEKFENDRDEQEDAVMEAMLDAEQSGYGEFADDFDKLGYAVPDGTKPQTDNAEEEEEEEVVNLFRKVETSMKGAPSFLGRHETSSEGGKRPTKRQKFS